VVRAFFVFFIRTFPVQAVENTLIFHSYGDHLIAYQQEVREDRR
jgi:hypothetical protein